LADSRELHQSASKRRGSMALVKFSNAIGSPSTNAMFGIETPMGRTPFQGASLEVASPRAEAPDFAKRLD
jgi:hypothetical protein